MQEQDALKTEVRTMPSDAKLYDYASSRLMPMTIDLCWLAYNKITLRLLRDIALSSPRAETITEYPYGKEPFASAYQLAEKNVRRQITAYMKGLPADEKAKIDSLIENKEVDAYESHMKKAVNDSWYFDDVHIYFVDNMSRAYADVFAEIERRFAGFIEYLLKDPVFALISQTIGQDLKLNVEEKLDYPLDHYVIYQYLGGFRDDATGMALSWTDLMRYADYLPEHATKVIHEISNNLSWTPKLHIILPHEYKVRRLIDELAKNEISKGLYEEDLNEVLRHIRNDYMRKEGFDITYQQSHYDRYETENLDFKDAARKRVIADIGYEPDLVHSLGAELEMRRRMAIGNPYFWEGQLNEMFCLPADYIVAAVISYRETLLSQGREAADLLPITRMRRKSL